MAYQFICDQSKCFNCGVCMDICPIRCLDMTRPDGPSVEPDGATPKPWMMAFPVQVAKCHGCNVCIYECPVEAISVVAVAEEPEYAATPGLTYDRVNGAVDRAWVSLSVLTREPFKKVPSDAWGRLHKWKLAKRAGPWQTWRTWKAQAEEVEEVPA